MTILAISGSLRADSSNSAVVRAAARLVPEDVEYTIYEHLGDLPHFNPGLDGELTPPLIHDLRERLRAADAVLICTPEYVFGMPGSLKNALDWIVSSGEFTNKPVSAISASPSYKGGDKAHAALVMTLTVMGARIIEDASLIIGFVRKKITPEGEISDPELERSLRSAVEALR